MASTVQQQLDALTQIRALVTKHFPKEDFFYIQDNLQNFIDLDDRQDIVYDEDRNLYVLEVVPACKGCDDTRSSLIEVPTTAGKFYICQKCREQIITAKPLVATP